MFGEPMTPKLIAEIPLDITETFSYLYMPIKLPEHIMVSLNVEDRLKCVSPLVGRSISDFIGEYGIDRYVDSYVYITCHNLYQAESPYNRPGWHTDGFGTDDVNYIWSNSQPTIFNDGPFSLSADDSRSMLEMEDQALQENNYCYNDCSLVRLTPSVVHKVGEFIPGMRCFFKLSFSYDKYDLKGNTHNYHLDYNWKMRDRSTVRNTPQAKED
jgi:hypothetical protein